MKHTTKIIATFTLVAALSAPAVATTQSTTSTEAQGAKAIKVIKIPSADEHATQKNKETQTTTVKTEQAPANKTTQEASTKAKEESASKATKTETPKTKSESDKKKESTETKTANSKMINEDFFVSVEWLKKNIKSCIVIDCRPNSLYKSGHIPGAVNAEWTYFAKINVPNGTEKWGTVLTPETLSKRIASLGINDKKPVVVYCDDKGWGQSGWALWVLRQAGLKNVYELDGGFTEWKQHGGTVTKAEKKATPVAFKVTSYLPGFSIDTASLSERLHDFYILDVRTKAEYEGKIRPFQEKRAGHIPGAIHIEKDEVVDEENLVKTRENIEKLLTKAGIGKDKPIVVYDTAGVRSAFVTMILCRVGYRAINYDPGFQAWAGNKDLPVECNVKTKSR